LALYKENLTINLSLGVFSLEVLMKKYWARKEVDTQRLAESLAQKTKKGDVIALIGDLGSGKTFFAGAFINYFLKNPVSVTSPTFNLIKTYETPQFTIHHLDLYRLKTVEELWELDVDSIFQDVTLVEWPDLLYQIRISGRWREVRLKILNNGGREILLDV
jgi:tRNA threonylcarbamoyl adenosine modification protein YjeE